MADKKSTYAGCLLGMAVGDAMGYTVDGKRYHHIIDKDTLMPSEYFLSVSVLSDNSGLADALSTALFNTDVETGLLLVESLPDVEAMWVLPSGEIKYSKGFSDYVQK